MALHLAKGKKQAHADASEKGTQAQETGAHAGAGPAHGRRPGAGAQKSEMGVCIICGEARNGAHADPEMPVRLARWLRAVLKQPARHTIACGEHLAEAKSRRAKYEKKQRDYLLGAAAFFAFVLFGSLFFGKFEFSSFVPAILGAVIIASLPCFYYFPSFGK